MSSKGDSKPGFFKRLFGGGSSKKSDKSGSGGSKRSEGRQAGTSDNTATAAAGLSAAERPKPKHSPLLAPPVKTRTSSSGSDYSGGGKGGMSSADTGGSQQARRPKQKGRKSTKHRKRTKAMIDPGAIKVDVDKPIEFPTTPEMILAHHKAKPFLSHNEEWLLVELNEYECLVDSIDIIKNIAEHSKFFEVEPDQLWEEFFEFVDEVSSYDEIINYDVWQEFRDVKYQC